MERPEKPALVTIVYAISAGNATVTGGLTAGSIETSGNVKAGSVNVTDDAAIGGAETVTGTVTAGGFSTTGSATVGGSMVAGEISRKSGSNEYAVWDAGNTAPESVNLYAASGAPIDSTKTKYTAKYFPVLGMTFVRIYVQTNATINTGADVNILAIGTTHTPEVTHALAARCANNVAASIDSNGYIRVRAYESVGSGYDIHITGWINA